MDSCEEPHASPEAIKALSLLLVGDAPKEYPGRTDILGKSSFSSDVVYQICRYFDAALVHGCGFQLAVDAYTCAFLDLLVEYNISDLLDIEEFDFARIAALKKDHPDLQRKVESLVKQHLPSWEVNFT